MLRFIEHDFIALDPRARRHQRHSIVDHRDQVDRARRFWRVAGKGPKVLDDARRTGRKIRNAPKIFIRLCVAITFQKDTRIVRKPADGGLGLVQLMRDARGHIAKR